MRPCPELGKLRRRLLRRFLAESPLCPAEVALAIGVSPEYFAKLLAGSRLVSDAICWQLLHRYGVPFDLLEPGQLYEGPAWDLYVELRRDVRTWLHKCPTPAPASCRYQAHGCPGTPTPMPVR
jgi:transcriptional regulator with XRE-family HTH domain